MQPGTPPLPLLPLEHQLLAKPCASSSSSSGCWISPTLALHFPSSSSQGLVPAVANHCPKQNFQKDFQRPELTCGLGRNTGVLNVTSLRPVSVTSDNALSKATLVASGGRHRKEVWGCACLDEVLTVQLLLRTERRGPKQRKSQAGALFSRFGIWGERNLFCNKTTLLK